MICYIEVSFIDSDVLYRGALYRLICYIEVPFIDSDLLYRGTLYRLICYIEVPFIDSDVLYRGALSGMFDYIKLLFHLYFRERVLNATLNEANVQHLKPDTNYEFRIRTYNSHGPSPNFARISITTERDSKLSSHFVMPISACAGLSCILYHKLLCYISFIKKFYVIFGQVWFNCFFFCSWRGVLDTTLCDEVCQ